MYRLLLIWFTLAASTLRAEEQHSIMTALQSTTLSGYVDTSANFWAGIAPPQAIALATGTVSFTEKLTDSVVVSDGFSEVRPVVSGTMNMSVTVPGLENVNFTPETTIAAGIGSLHLGGTISEGVRSGNSVTFTLYDDSSEPRKKIGQATFTKAGDVLKLTASASDLQGGSIVTDLLSPDPGTESGESIFTVEVGELMAGGRVYFKATKTVTVRTIDGEPTELRSISVNGQRDNTKPTLTVAAPKNNARLLSPDILVRGTAKDNMGVPTVWVNLNSSEQWAQAEGGTTWSNLVHLVPGPNIIRILCEDGDGNRSTAVLTMTYGKTQQFNVSISGKGTLSPNLNGRFLEVGKRYTVTAVPASGFRFEQWSQGFSTNVEEQKKTFVMPDQPVLVEPSFRDLAAPIVTITSPKPNARVASSVVTFTGTARDNDRVAVVRWKMDEFGWFDAQGTNVWQGQTAVSLGSHTLYVYSQDFEGNRSKTNRVTFRVPDYRGIYFGNYSEPQGRGVVGVLVTADQKLIVITGDTTSSFDSATKIDYLEIGFDGKFDQTIEGERIFGTFTDTGFSGKFITTDNATGTFSGAKKAATGMQADHAGYYVGTYQLPGETGEVRGILAADGRMVITVMSPPLPGENGDRAAGAGTGTINASGVLTATVGGAPIRGNLQGFVISGTFRAQAGDGTFQMTQVATPWNLRNSVVVTSGSTRLGGFEEWRTQVPLLNQPEVPAETAVQPPTVNHQIIEAGGSMAKAAPEDQIQIQTVTAPVLKVIVRDDGFGFLFSTEVGRKYRVEASYDLVNWGVLLPFTATSGEYYFVDPEFGDAFRFYRLVAE